MKRMKKLLLVLCSAVFVTVSALEALPVYAANEITNAEGYHAPQVTEQVVSEYTDVYEPSYTRNAGSSYWAKYGSDYYYNQMTASQKNLYDGLYQMCMAYLTGTGDINGKTAVMNASREYTQGVSYSGLTDTEAINTTIAFVNSNPQFYFLDGEDYVREYYAGVENAGTIYVDVYDEFVDGATRQNYTDQFQSVIDNWMSQVNAQASVLDKEYKAHELVITNTIYKDGASYNQSCYSVFMRGQSVCAGYAEAFELLCNGAGIETIIVTSATHEWNQIHIGDYWYAVDPTWADTSGTLAYYNVSDETLRKNNRSHVPETFWSTVNRPECKYDYGKEDTSSDNGTTSGGSSSGGTSNSGAQNRAYTAVHNGTDYSRIFDPYYYADTYGDLKQAYGYDCNSLLQHFINYGMAEGRQAKSGFNVTSYRLQYADLRRAYGADLKSYYMHYVNYGAKEGRSGIGCTTLQGAVTVLGGVDYSAVYDYQYYVNKYADIKTAYGYDDLAVLQHFVNYGMKEGRQAKSSFDVNSYRLQYADLRGVYGNDLKSYYTHYINYGRKEGRVATGCTTLQGGTTVYRSVNYAAVYDFSYYVANNPDVYRAYGNDDVAVLQHFVNHGMQEGRRACAGFSVQTYCTNYADLQRAYGNDWKAYYMHYINYGVREGRRGV